MKNNIFIVNEEDEQLEIEGFDYDKTFVKYFSKDGKFYKDSSCVSEVSEHQIKVDSFRNQVIIVKKKTLIKNIFFVEEGQNFPKDENFDFDATTVTYFYNDGKYYKDLNCTNEVLEEQIKKDSYTKQVVIRNVKQIEDKFEQRKGRNI